MVEEDIPVSPRRPVKVNDDIHQRIRAYIVEQVDAETALRMDVRSLERAVSRIVAEAVSTMRLFLNG